MHVLMVGVMLVAMVLLARLRSRSVLGTVKGCERVDEVASLSRNVHRRGHCALLVLMY